MADNSNTVWDISKFSIGRKLGEGQFGAVFLVRENSSSFVMALKMVNKKFILANDFAKQLKREIEIQSHLVHSNIIRLYGYFHDESRVYIMLEYAHKGQLYDDIINYRFSNERTATYIYQIGHALQYCHSKNVLHRDIKPENVLMAKDGQIKLADFGWSVHNKSGIRTTFCGTQDYLAPEMFNDNLYGDKVDVWCVGILTFEMLSGTVPFYAETSEEVKRNILELRYIFPGDMKYIAQDFIKAILILDPAERPTISEVIELEYIQHFSEKVLHKCQAALDQWGSI